MKEKYILEKYPEWYKFGASEPYMVDIADPYNIALATLRSG